MPTTASTPSSRGKVNKCHKKTYKEALTGKISHISQTASLDESDFPSFIPAGIEGKKLVWPLNVSNPDSNLQTKLERENTEGKRSGAGGDSSSGAPEVEVGRGETEKTKPGQNSFRLRSPGGRLARNHFRPWGQHFQSSSAWRPRRGSNWSRERKQTKSEEKIPGDGRAVLGGTKVESLLYLPSCSGSKDATVHFFPEKFQIPRYSFDMVYYEKLGLYLRGKTFNLMIYLNHRLLAGILSFLLSLNSLRNTT